MRLLLLSMLKKWITYLVGRVDIDGMSRKCVDTAGAKDKDGIMQVAQSSLSVTSHP